MEQYSKTNSKATILTGKTASNSAVSVGTSNIFLMYTILYSQVLDYSQVNATNALALAA